MRSWILVAVSVMVIPTTSLAQQEKVLRLPLASWTLPEYKMRPARRLTEAEARTWIANIRLRGGVYNLASPVEPKTIIEVSTADTAYLKRYLAGPGAKALNPLALFEVAIRRDKSFIPNVRHMALTDPDAYPVLRHLDPSKARLIDMHRSAAGASKEYAARDLLRLGETTGVATIRDAIRYKRNFASPFGAYWQLESEMAYLLVRYTDGRNQNAIRRDLDSAETGVRRYFPKLASLKNPAIDAVLTGKAKSKDHATRKWIALAAKDRRDSASYQSALRLLAKDSVPDVRQTALWALGKGEKPKNLINQIGG